MAKNPIITDDIKALIAQFCLRHPSWKAKDIQIRVSQVLHSRNPQLPSGWPGLSAVQKVLATVRKSHDDPQDKPWSMGTLIEYPIPPDAIPAVLKVWKLCDDAVRKYGVNKGEGSLAFDPTLTIRGAKWVARLAHVTDDLGVVQAYANWYAEVERIYQYLGKPFDSHVLDDEIMKPDPQRIPLRQTAFGDFMGVLYKEFDERRQKNER